MLAHADEYNIHPDVADSVAPYLLSLTAESQTLWGDCKGLSDFILADGFKKYTASVEELVRFAQWLGRSYLVGAAGGPQHTKEFLCCASALVSRASTLDFSPEQYCDSFCGSLYQIIGHLSSTPRENNEFIILPHFPSDTTVLDRWMELFWHYHQEPAQPTRARRMRTLLHDALACALRRRSRVNLEVNPEWTHALFSNQTTIRIAEYASRLGATEDPTNSNGFSGAVFGGAKSFLRHWRHLSPSSWSTLCDQLHNSRGESGLAEEDVERFRQGLLPGDIDGSLDIDCDSDCDCMRPYAIDLNPPLAEATRLSAEGGWRDRWGQRVKHWRPWTDRMPPSNAGQEAHELSAAV